MTVLHRSKQKEGQAQCSSVCAQSDAWHEQWTGGCHSPIQVATMFLDLYQPCVCDANEIQHFRMHISSSLSSLSAKLSSEKSCVVISTNHEWYCDILAKMYFVCMMLSEENGQASPSSNQAAPSENGEDEEGLAGNPVGELQEMTQKKLWPPPIYDFTSEQGPPHAREFICTVRLFNIAEQGELCDSYPQLDDNGMITIMEKPSIQRECIMINSIAVWQIVNTIQCVIKCNIQIYCSS